MVTHFDGFRFKQPGQKFLASRRGKHGVVVVVVVSSTNSRTQMYLVQYKVDVSNLVPHFN